MIAGYPATSGERSANANNAPALAVVAGKLQRTTTCAARSRRAATGSGAAGSRRLQERQRGRFRVMHAKAMSRVSSSARSCSRSDAPRISSACSTSPTASARLARGARRRCAASIAKIGCRTRTRSPCSAARRAYRAPPASRAREFRRGRRDRRAGPEHGRIRVKLGDGARTELLVAVPGSARGHARRERAALAARAGELDHSPRRPAAARSRRGDERCRGAVDLAGIDRERSRATARPDCVRCSTKTGPSCGPRASVENVT